MASTLPPNPYKILGVSKDAKLPELRIAYRKLIVKCHPEKIQDEAFRAIKRNEYDRVQLAYELLSDGLRRKYYDEQVKLFELRKELDSGNPTPRVNLSEHEVRSVERRNSWKAAERDEPGPLESNQDQHEDYAAQYMAVACRKEGTNDSFESAEQRRARRTGSGDSYIVESPSAPPREKKPPAWHSSGFDSGYESDPQQCRPSSRLRKSVICFSDPDSDSDSDSPLYAQSPPRPRPRRRHYLINDDRQSSQYDLTPPSYESPRRNSTSTTKRPQLRRQNSFGYTESTTRKMHHTMGSDYGGSEDEEAYRSRPTNRSGLSSRQRSYNRNRRHSDAYKPPNPNRLVGVLEILSSTNKESQPTSQEPQERTALHLDCPNCTETFSDLRLILQHHEKKHLSSIASSSGNQLKPETPTSSPVQATEQKDSASSDDSTPSSPAGESLDSAPLTTLTDPLTDAESDKDIPSDIPLSAPSVTPGKPASRRLSIYSIPRLIVSYFCKATIRFLGHQTTAWSALVLTTAATAISTTLSLSGPAPSPPPHTGDSNYYSSLSQSIIAICSLYYLLVPFLRGDEELPVRKLFYVSWALGLAGALATPLVYGRGWEKSVWCGFGSAISQTVATAFLFEHVGDRGRHRAAR